MANKILVVMGTPIVWAGATYSGDGGAKTHAITLTDLAEAAARAGESADIDTGGVVNRFPKLFSVTVRVEYPAGGPGVDNQSVDLYWSPTLALGGPYPNGFSGSDGAYTGTAGSSIADSVKALQFLGKLIATDDESIQQQTFRVALPTQWGQPVVFNNSGDALMTDDNEMSITFTPYEYEVQ